MAERGKAGAATSPSASTVAPSASTTATAPVWRLSTRLPRVTSTRTGLGIGVASEPGCRHICKARSLRFLTWHAMAIRLKTLRMTMLVVFALPIAARGGLYAVADHPRSWRTANWSSTHMLPPAEQDPEARVLVFAARAGGRRSVFAVHTWVVVKPQNAAAYTRYDVMGFGQPVRLNMHEPHAHSFCDR